MSNEVSVSGVLNVETSSVREIRPSGVLKHWSMHVCTLRIECRMLSKWQMAGRLSPNTT